MKLSCVAKDTDENATEQLVEVGNPELLQQQAESSLLQQQAESSFATELVIGGSGSRTSIVAAPVDVDGNVHDAAGAPCAMPAELPQVLQHTRNDSSNSGGNVHSSTGDGTHAREADASTPAGMAHDSLIEVVHRQPPVRVSPEEKMVYLHQKEALLERKAKVLARQHVWGSHAGFFLNGSNDDDSVAEEEQSAWASSGTRPRSERRGGGHSRQGSAGQRHKFAAKRGPGGTGPFARLQLVPPPITMPWAEKENATTAGSAASPNSKGEGGSGAINNGGGNGLGRNLSSESLATLGNTLRPITRVVRMSATAEQGIELAFDLTFRPGASGSNSCSCLTPNTANAEAEESPTPDEFYKAIAQVPFVLTYLHGDNDLSEDTSRLAYATPTTRSDAKDDNASSNGGGGGGGGGGVADMANSTDDTNDDMACNEDINKASSEDRSSGPDQGGDMDDPLHHGSTCDGGPRSRLDTPQVVTVSVSDTTASPNKKGRALVVSRMNRKWRVVFPYVSFARTPQAQSVHVLYVSQAPTKFGEITGLEVPIVIMEPLRIKVRLQQAPRLAEEVEDERDESNSDEEGAGNDKHTSTVSGERGEDEKKRNKAKRKRSLSNRKAGDDNANANDGARREGAGAAGVGKKRLGDSAVKQGGNLSFTSQTPSMVCQLADDSFLELTPETHGSDTFLDLGVPAVLTAAHLRRMEEEQQQQQQQQEQHGVAMASPWASSDTRVSNVLPLTGNPHETQFGRVLLDIEADDIVFDVEFSIRAHVDARRMLSIYAKEFLPSELIRYVYVPPTVQNTDVAIREQQQRQGEKTAACARDISTRWVIPVVAPLVAPLPVSVGGGGGSRRKSPSISVLSRGTSTVGGGLFDSTLLPPPHPPAAGDAYAAAAASGKPPVPPLSAYGNPDPASPAAAGGTAPPACRTSSEVMSPGTFSPLASPLHCRLVLQVDVRLASLPRQVFRETFPLTVMFPGASHAGSSRNSVSNTPLSVPMTAGPHPPLNTDGGVGVGKSCDVEDSKDGKTVLLSNPQFGAYLDVPAQSGKAAVAATTGSPGSAHSSNLTHPSFSNADASDDLVPKAASGTMVSRECGSNSCRHDQPHVTDSSNNNNDSTGKQQLQSTTICQSDSVGSTSTPVDLGVVPQAAVTKLPAFSSGTDTPRSHHLRISRPNSRSSSPSASPALSMLSTRKVSLAHVSVTAFSICRSGAILSFYRNHNSPHESELGFSPLNAMNQCAPVNLHGLEKFALLLTDRYQRKEEEEEEAKAREEEGPHRASGKRKTSLTHERKRRHSSLSTPKQLYTTDALSVDTNFLQGVNNTPNRREDGATAATPTTTTSLTAEESRRTISESKRSHKHHHKHRHHNRQDRSRTLERMSEDLDSRGGGGAWRIVEDAIRWRLERSIDANYVLLRERGTTRCFAFRMRGSRSKHGQDNAVGGKRMNKLDLMAVACFEPELPPRKHLAAAKKDGKAAATRKPVKQQYLLSDHQVLTLTLDGNLLLTEVSTIEKIKSDEAVAAPPSSSTTPAAGVGGADALAVMPTTPATPALSAQQHILQQLQNFSLRVGMTSMLPIPGSCNCFTAWMLENEDDNTLILIAINAAEPYRGGAGSSSSSTVAGGDAAMSEAVGKDGETHRTGAAETPFRRVLVYCVEETKVLYEFQLGMPTSILPQSVSQSTLFSPSPPSSHLSPVSGEGPSGGTQLTPVSSSNKALPSKLQPGQARKDRCPPPPPLLPLFYACISASVRGFTVVSAHVETAMVIAWTPYQADVLTCCPAWAHFSLFFVTPAFLTAAGAGLPVHGGGGDGDEGKGSGGEVGSSPDHVDPVEDLLSPLGVEWSREGKLARFSGSRAGGKDGAKPIGSNSSRDLDSGLLTILCVCPGDRAPHALVGAASKAEKEKQREDEGKAGAGGDAQAVAAMRYSEEFLAFFLLSNGAIYALTAPCNNRSNAAHSKSGVGSTGGSATGSSATGRGDEPRNVCASHRVGGDMFIHVDETASPSVATPNTSGAARDFPLRAKKSPNGHPSRSSPASSLSPASLTADGSDTSSALERELRVVRVGTVFNACFHTPSAVENCAMRYCPVDRDFLDVRGMLYLYGTHASTKELIKDAVVVE